MNWGIFKAERERERERDLRFWREKGRRESSIGVREAEGGHVY
jgi:hypothetical protein